MEYVVLPRTDLCVSRVCLGTMQFSALAEEGKADVTWGATSQQEVNRTVRAALDSGINFFDCAEAYGNRSAERALGKALRASGYPRSRYVVATKCGRHAPLWETDDPTGTPPVGPDGSPTGFVYSPEAVRRAIGDSRAALGLGCIDLFQVHWPVNLGLNPHHGSWPDLTGVVEVLREAQLAGTIRYWGVCNFGTDDLERLAEGGGVPATNQLPYNLLWRGVERGILPTCSAAGVGVLCYSPLQQGLLAGKQRAPADVPPGRRRTRFYGPSADARSRHGGGGAEKLLFATGGVLDRLRQLCSAAGVSMAQLATAWLLSRAEVTCVIVGASTAEQALQNARLPSVPAELLRDATAISELLAAHFQGAVDQYARVPRIHGGSPKALIAPALRYSAAPRL